MPFRKASVSFRATPVRGAAPEKLDNFRWGGAATAHQTAEPEPIFVNVVESFLGGSDPRNNTNQRHQSYTDD